MSILDALKVQKANQQSVSELAALPQNEIVRLAQMGQIPADVVPVVISEKARMAKEMANMRAAQQMQQQGGKMPTVIEQAMQANAQAEAPQVPQQQPGLPSAMPGAQAQAPMQMPPQGAAPQGAPAEPGVAGLPTGDMFKGQSFEAGGIVAFSDGGEMPDMPSKDLMRAFANAQRDNATGRDIQVLMAGLGIDSGSIGVNLAKMSDGERDQLAQNLVAQYGTQFGDVGVQGQMVRPLDAPSGVYGLGASASYPLGQGRISAGVNAMRTPQDTRVTGYNVGYGGKVGPGFLNAGVNLPRGGKPSAEMRYQIPFEAGGIVAFAGKGPSLVKDEFAGLDEAIARAAANPAPQVMTEDQAMAALQGAGQQSTQPGSSGRASLADRLAELEALKAPYQVVSPEEEALASMIKKGTMSQGDIDQQKYMRLLEAGLGIMGGESPYAFTNIGKGAQSALKGYGEDIAAQRAAKLNDLKMSAELAKGKRLEKLQNVSEAVKLHEADLNRELRQDIAKDSQLGAKYADNYLAMKKAGGDKRPDEVIRDEGYRTFFQEYGFASGRAATQAQIAAGSQGVQTTGQQQTARSTAVKEFNDLKMSDPIKRRYNQLATEDKKNAQAGNPTSLAEDYKNQQIGNMEKRILGQAPAAAPAAAPAGGGGQMPDISKIKGAPSGSKVGAFVQGKGWEIRGKDGTLLGYAQGQK